MAERDFRGVIPETFTDEGAEPALVDNAINRLKFITNATNKIVIGPAFMPVVTRYKENFKLIWYCHPISREIVCIAHRETGNIGRPDAVREFHIRITPFILDFPMDSRTPFRGDFYDPYQNSFAKGFEGLRPNVFKKRMATRIHYDPALYEHFHAGLENLFLDAELRTRLGDPANQEIDLPATFAYWNTYVAPRKESFPIDFWTIEDKNMVSAEQETTTVHFAKSLRDMFNEIYS